MSDINRDKKIKDELITWSNRIPKKMSDELLQYGLKLKEKGLLDKVNKYNLTGFALRLLHKHLSKKLNND